MEAPAFLRLFEGHQALVTLAEAADAPPGEKIHLKGIYGSALSILVAQLFRETGKSFLIILPEREDAAYFYDDLVSLGLETPALFFPSSYKRSVQFGQPEQELSLIHI